jgi:predicted short-subunit dehydrogenase-like oxidoreductase (DUF2520 family)
LERIVIIGSGNLATQLSYAIKRAGHDIVQVYSRTQNHAKELADKLNTGFTSNIQSITNYADIYIFAVSDSAILPILKSRPWHGKYLVHTAGSVPLDIFRAYTNTYGVLYPLQTFSKERDIQFETIPVFIEASDDNSIEKLLQLGNSISNKVQSITSQQRSVLHLAGVFVNNFSNHMLTLGESLLNKNDLSVEYLKPLIQETFTKALELSPKQAQTGPAVRNNREIIQKHLNMLLDERDSRNIYYAVSESIIKMYSNTPIQK